MKLLLLAAFVAVVASVRLGTTISENWPWQVGKLYRYDVQTNTLARLEQGSSTGAAFQARFIVRVLAPGHLQAKLEKPQHAKIHQDLPNTWSVPEDIKYEDVKNLDLPFEIYLDGGRVQSLKLAPTVSLSNENVLKGLISALQVDLSTHRNEHSAHDTHDHVTEQGQYRKMETDVTGDCETLYTVLPVASEWRRELPNFALEEEPFEVTKTRDYKHCHHRVAYHFGVPESVKWTGTSKNPKEVQFMKRKTDSRILVGKQGIIYKAESTSTVSVGVHLYGKQKAQVRSHVKLTLVSHEQDKEAVWQIPEGSRNVMNLLYALRSKQVTIKDSSSSSSSSESHEHHHHEMEQEHHSSESQEAGRVRRSLKMPRKIVSVNKITIKKRSDDSSSSSSSESNSAYVNDDVPLINEPAYAALFMSAQPHVDKKQNPMNAQKLVQELAQQLQNPNNMPKNDFLAKFNILVRVIAAMNWEQLSQTSRSIEIAKSSSNIMKLDMWMIYRDAVVQAGTMPTFQQIKSWIQTKKITGEEAAQVIASLPATLRYPTKEVMIQFFKLAMSPVVQEQKYLNTTALIAATRFINMGQVNNATAHVNYPTHMYGRLADKYDNFVLEEILPRLNQELEKAIQSVDNHKALIYVKAIGHLGHRAILDVFAPYLEGKVQVSNYLRASMVEILQLLAYQKDHYARAVLYSILRNTAEPYEVRVLAAQGVFVSEPTGAMMHAMAEMTQKDPSLHVRAALKAGIQTSAKLTSPRFYNLARTAQAALPTLTKDDFGSLKWGQKLGESLNEDYVLDIFNVFSYVSSEDSLFPKNLKYSWMSKTAAWTKMNTISASFSNYRQFIDQLLQKMNILKQKVPKSNAEHKFSAEHIADVLNFKREAQIPMEASFYIDFMNQQRYFSLTEEDMEQLPAVLGQFMANLGQGIDHHYTKVINQAQVTIMFPVASGMPFIYQYKEPTVIHIQSKTKGQIKFPAVENPEYSSSMEQEIQFTYARNIEGTVGFLDTIANQFALAGLDSKYQINIPVKSQIQAKMGEIKIRLEPLRPDQDTTLVYYSVWPYTTSQKMDTLTPVSLDPATKVIIRKHKVVDVDTKFGQITGTTFQIQGYSYSNDYKTFGSMHRGIGLVSDIAFGLTQDDVAMTHFNFRYLGKKSQNKAISITAVYDTLYNQKQAQAPVEATEIPDIAPNSVTRRQEIVKRAVAGINTAKAHIIDLSATFEGSQKAEYVVTAAIGDSKVDSKIGYAIFAGRNTEKIGNYQFNSVGSLNMPSVTALNFLFALKKELKTTFEADINLGQKDGNIKVKALGARSVKAIENMLMDPNGKQCLQEIESNNFYQDACRMMILRAHAPSHVKTFVTYKNLSPAVKNVTFQAYQAFTKLGFWYSEFNPFKHIGEGELELDAEMSFEDNYLNLDILSYIGLMKMNHVPIPKFSAAVLSAYKPWNVYERLLNRFTQQQFVPFCTVDGTKIRTFSNRSYDYTLNPSWHVVMHDDAQYAGQCGYKSEQLVIMARQPVQKQKEVYISYKSETGKDLEITVEVVDKKPVVKVQTNAKKVSEGELTMYWDEVRDGPLLQYYMLDDVTLMLQIGEDRLRVMYDGMRVVVFAKDNRNNIRGVCGYMSGEPRDDYMTPYGLVDKPELFGVSYALNLDAEPGIQLLQTDLKKYVYQPKYQFTTILRSDDQWKQSMHSSEEQEYNRNRRESAAFAYRARSHLKQQGGCQLHPQVQYYENQSDICISTTQVPGCQSHCRGLDYHLQPVQVVCGSKLDMKFQEYRNEIQRGGNPQVTGESQVRQYRVPSSCQM